MIALPPMFCIGEDLLLELNLRELRWIAPPSSCIKCEGPMQLARVQDGERGWELHLYECTECNSQESYLVRKLSDER